MYPDFIGIGAQKAGTTWLYQNLRIVESVKRHHKERDWTATNPRHLGFVDEMGTQASLAPLYAYAPIGERAFFEIPRNRGRNTALLAGLHSEGMGRALVNSLKAAEGKLEGSPNEFGNLSAGSRDERGKVGGWSRNWKADEASGRPACWRRLVTLGTRYSESGKWSDLDGGGVNRTYLALSGAKRLLAIKQPDMFSALG